MARRYARLAVAGLLLTAVAGCGSRRPATAVPPPAPPAATPAPATPPPATATPPATPPPRAATPAVPAITMCRPHELEAVQAARTQALVAAGRRVNPGDVGYYMDVQQARLRQIAVPALGIERADQRVRLNLPGSWGFAVGSADLSADARQALGRVASVLAEYRASLITVHGHTDSSGDAAFNRQLSERRALSVARLLVEAGVAADRILVVGHGADRPVASNANEDGRDRNRRVELQVDPVV